MVVTPRFLEQFRFNFSTFADYIRIYSGRIAVREYEKGKKPEMYGELSQTLLKIANLCLAAHKYVAAYKILGMAHYAARQAILGNNVQKCVKRCEDILSGKAVEK